MRSPGQGPGRFLDLQRHLARRPADPYLFSAALHGAALGEASSGIHVRFHSLALLLGRSAKSVPQRALDTSRTEGINGTGRRSPCDAAADGPAAPFISGCHEAGHAGSRSTMLTASANVGRLLGSAAVLVLLAASSCVHGHEGARGQTPFPNSRKRRQTPRNFGPGASFLCIFASAAAAAVGTFVQNSPGFRGT
jgi:hypothetical protein